MKIGAKGFPGGAASSFNLRTRDRDRGKSMKFFRKYRKINENRCQGLPRRGGEQFQFVNKGPRPMKINENQRTLMAGDRKSMIIDEKYGNR